MSSPAHSYLSTTIREALSRASEPLPLAQPLPHATTGADLVRQAPATLFPGALHPEAALAGLALRLGFWEHSHQIAQDIETPEGSYWHAIVHRLEPDTANSAYWFRRVGSHSIFRDLHRCAAGLIQQSAEGSVKLETEWNPYLFNDWCERARRDASSSLARLCIEIQQAEWELLFNWCAAASA